MFERRTGLFEQVSESSQYQIFVLMDQEIAWLSPAYETLKVFFNSSNITKMILRLHLLQPGSASDVNMATYPIFITVFVLTDVLTRCDASF
jgi:hypothetical protein